MNSWKNRFLEAVFFIYITLPILAKCQGIQYRKGRFEGTENARISCAYFGIRLIKI